MWKTLFKKNVQKTDQSAVWSSRFLLWVDGVGGFLVCLGNEVRIGANRGEASSAAEIPVSGNLSRNHAVIQRTAGGYLIDPKSTCSVNGDVVEERALLFDRSTLAFGEHVTCTFRQPTSLSMTAVLQFEGIHRPRKNLDGVILWESVCVMGSGGQSHIYCPTWKTQVVLGLRNQKLIAQLSRSTDSSTIESVTVNERPYSAERGILPGDVVAGENFCFRLESLDDSTPA